MWCPSCQSRSPLVAIQPEGLICARCQVEVEFGDRVTGQQTAQVKLAAPHQPKSAAGQCDFAEQLTSVNRLAVAAGLSGGHSSASSQLPPHRASRPALNSPGASADSKPVQSPAAGASPFEKNPGNQPLFRFDAAHPPVGGRTEAALELQRKRSSIATPSFRTQTAAQAASVPAPSSIESASRAVPMASERGRIESGAIEELIRVRELANFPQASPAQPVTPPSGSASEYAIRRVPRSFLFPRRTNRWPGRLCLFAGGLFISGQSLLLTSFLRSESLGVAAGVLASATAFALALYVIARYCDEELER